MPPRLITRRNHETAMPAPAPAATGPIRAVAPAATGTVSRLSDRLRTRERMLTAGELADVLGFSNPKRVYALPIRRTSVGHGGARALRWDPVDVADFLDGIRHCA